MPKSDIELLYDRLRHSIKPWHNKPFHGWVKFKNQDKDLHHLIGSMGALKLTDSLLMPLTREEHIKAEKDRHSYFMEGLPVAINLLQDYIIMLQGNIHKLNDELLTYTNPGEIEDLEEDD